MYGEDHYIKVIDFGEAKYVDTFDNESMFSHQSKLSKSRTRKNRAGIPDSNSGEGSDGASSFFGRMGKDNKKTKIIKKGTFVGTPLYCAPEMLEHSKSGLFSDLWALGCIIYELTSG